MKTALVETKPESGEYVAKEMAGGLGKRLDLKGSFLGSLLDRQLQSSFSAPPMILAQLAGVIKKLGHEVAAYHTSTPSDLPSDTEIMFVLSSMVDYRNEVDFIRRAKSHHKKLKAVVVGSFGTALSEVYEKEADLVIGGSPEAAVEQILTAGFPPERFLKSPDPVDLDALPMPDWTPFIKNGAYARRPFSKELGVSIQKSRGCTMTCNYCPYAALYGKVRLYSAETTLKAIEHYYDNHNIRYFMFRDPNFGEKRTAFREFMKVLIESRFEITWSCEMRLDTFEDDDLRLMAKAGLRYVITGIESSDEKILSENMRKAYKKADTVRKLHLLESLGVVVQTNWIIGFQGESEEGVLDTIRYSKSLNTMFATFHIFTPQPGTDIFTQYKDQFLDVDWEDFSYSHLVWKHDTLSKEFLEKALHNAYVSYYFRPGWALKHHRSLLKLLF